MIVKTAFEGLLPPFRQTFKKSSFLNFYSRKYYKVHILSLKMDSTVDYHVLIKEQVFVTRW